MADSFDRDVGIVSPLLADLFTIDAVYRHDSRLAFSLTSRYDRDRSAGVLRERLHTAGYHFELSLSDAGPVVLLISTRRSLRVPRLNIALFLATIVTVYLVPILLETGLSIDATMVRLRAGEGIRFTIALISILVVHEMGHFVAGRRRGVVTTWPYFIPAPNLFGTFGAVIRQKTPFWNRRDLLEVGAAGPIAGWIVAVAWLTYGLTQSVIVPQSLLTPQSIPFSMQGESVLMTILTTFIVGPQPAGHFYVLSEYAFAGWAGLLVTAINLLPVGQLDGGHVVYGLVGRRQKYFAWAGMVVLVVLGFWSATWWLLAVLAFVFRVNHPPTLDDDRQPSRIALTMGVIALIILLLSFTPVPFQA